MKKFFTSLLAIVSLSSSVAFAQSSPFEWNVGEGIKIKLSGFVYTSADYDYNGSVGGGNDFISTNIKKSNWSSDDSFNIDLSASRLALEITQATDAMGDVKAYFETDFRGSDMRLRQAFIEAKGFVAGLAWSFMADLAANAPTIDINGVGSRTFLRTRLVGYRCSLSDNLSAGIALELPKFSSERMSDYDYSAVTQSVPNIPIYLQLKGDAGHIKAGAMINTLQYGNADKKEKLSEVGLGGQLSGSLHATPAITIYGQAIYGTGINNYISNLASLDVNIMSSDGTSIEATPMGGASLGVGAKLSKEWSAAVSGSFVENYGDKDYFDGKFQKTTYLAAALFYAPAPRVTLGAEVLNGSRTNFGSDAIDASRFSLMAKYTF